MYARVTMMLDIEPGPGETVDEGTIEGIIIEGSQRVSYPVIEVVDIDVSID